MGYTDVWEHSRGDRHFDVDWSPIIEDLYSPELGFMDICAANVFPLPIQLHRVFGCTHTVHCAPQITTEY